jgi:hypothetical protein
MKNYSIKKLKVNKKILKSIKCDICKKIYYSDRDVFEVQEFISINHVCGYGGISDSDVIELDMCKDCFKKIHGKHYKLYNEMGELVE